MQKGGSQEQETHNPGARLGAKMSVLSPILTPPEVKEYLTKGERFIKWDDVSIMAFIVMPCSVNLIWGLLEERKRGLTVLPKYVHEYLFSSVFVDNPGMSVYISKLTVESMKDGAMLNEYLR